MCRGYDEYYTKEHALEMIEKTKEGYNQILTELGDSTETLKVQCEEIDEEVEVHNYLLGRIDDLTDKNVLWLKTLCIGFKIWSSSSLICTILILLLVLIALLAICNIFRPQEFE